jgi:hypothetical protein
LLSVFVFCCMLVQAHSLQLDAPPVTICWISSRETRGRTASLALFGKSTRLEVIVMTLSSQRDCLPSSTAETLIFFS